MGVASYLLRGMNDPNGELNRILETFNCNMIQARITYDPFVWTVCSVPNSHYLLC